MSDPILDFVKSQNETDETAKTNYDPIPAFQYQLDQVSGGAVDTSFDPELLSQIEAQGVSGKIAKGFEKGGKQFLADVRYTRGAFNALVGNEERARKFAMRAVTKQNEASNVVGALDMAKEWEKFIDEPTFEQFFTRAAPATIGEVGLSAITTITGALLGTAAAIYTAPATVPVGLSSLMVGGTATAAGKKSLNKLTKQLAFQNFSKTTIANAVSKAAAQKSLTKAEKEVMEAVYKQYQKNVLTKRTAIGQFAGITGAEAPRGIGTAFANYADQDKYDPISAALSIGQGTASAVIGGATETIVLRSLLNNFAKTTARKSVLTPAGKNMPRPSVLPGMAKALGISTVGEPITELLQTELEVQQKMGRLDPRLDGQLDEKYTQQQANLDRSVSALAGLTAGVTFGIGGASIQGATSKAQNLLDDYQGRDALINMVRQKYGPEGAGVQIEPKEWIQSQFDSLKDPDGDKNAVWIDINSEDEYQKFLAERAQEFKQSIPGLTPEASRIKMIEEGKVDPRLLFKYEMGDSKSQLGGTLFSTDPAVVERFQRIMENNMPSTKLLENTLAEILGYPRGRRNTDEWVVQVRNKETGSLVHYHQTGDPKEDGGVHLENAKKLFNNSDKYSYEIVEAQEHLDERASLVDTPAVDLDDVGTIRQMSLLSEEEAAEVMGTGNRIDPEGATGLRDDTGRYAQASQVVEDGVRVPPVKKENEKSILNRNKKPWTKPNPQFKRDQMPSSELVKNARLATHPDFRQEFDKNIEEENYSRILLTEFVKQVDRFGEIDTDNNTELVYKIDPEGEGYVINKYQQPLKKLQSYEQAKPEFDRIVRRAKQTGRKKKRVVDPTTGEVREGFADSLFTVTTREPDGNFSMPQSIDMPKLVREYRRVLARMGVLSNDQYYQSLADSFTSVFGTFEEDPDYELRFKGEKITDESLRDPDFVVVTEQQGKVQLGLGDLVAKGAEESLGISEIATNEEIKAAEERVEQKTKEIEALEEQLKDFATLRDEQEGKFVGNQYDQFMNLIEQLYGPKINQKRNGPLNLYIQRNELERDVREKKRSQGTDPSFDPRTDIEDTTDPENPGDFKEFTTEQVWDAEIEQYNKEPFSRSKITVKQETKTVSPFPIDEKPIKTEEKVFLSAVLEANTSSEAKKYFLAIGKLAKKHLKMNRPILLYTRQESIDLTETINSVPAFKQEVEKNLALHNKRSQRYENVGMEELTPPMSFEEFVKELNARLNTVKDQTGPETGTGGYMQGVFKTFDIIVLNNPDALTEYDAGLTSLILGHEVGHSFFRSEMGKVLKNPLLRRAFVRAFEKRKEEFRKNGQTSHQYFTENGFEEFFVDKVASGLFDLEKGVLLKANNVVDNYANTMAKGLNAFYNAKSETLKSNFLESMDPIPDGFPENIIQNTKETQAEQIKESNDFFQGRFTYDETVGEFIQGLKDKTLQEATNNMSFTERAHAEELIDSMFGNKTSIKFIRKINKDADNMVKSGKMPSWLTKLFFTARGFLDTLGKDTGVGKELGQIFHKVSGETGEPGFINEANRLLNELVNKLVNDLNMEPKEEVGRFDQIKQAVTGIYDSSFTQEEIDAFREAQDEKKPTEALSPKAQIIRKFLFDVYDTLELDKYEITAANFETMQFEKRKIARRANFFPRIILMAEIASNPKLKAKLIELLIEANPQIKDPNYIIAQVEKLISNNEKNPDATVEKDDSSGHGLGMPVPRARLFENLDTVTLVEEGLAAPGEIAILEYLKDVTRQVELQKRGGGKRIKQLINMLPKEEQGHAKEAVNAMLGRIDPIRFNMWRNINDGMLTLNVLTLLGMAVFASVPDVAGPVLRSRDFELKTIVKNVTEAMGKGEVEELARDIGANGREAMATTILYAGELDGVSLIAKKATNGWFRLTQLERWTVFTRKFAAGMARDFLLKHARIVEEGYEGDQVVMLSKRYLTDLGLTAKQVNDWNGADIDAHPEVKTALGRFVDEAIVRPNAAERPIWASDPHWAIVWQLKSFYYAYGKNIMGGLYREGNTRYRETGMLPTAIYPLFFGAALLTPLTMLGWDMRERFKIGLSYMLPGIDPNDPGVNYRASKNMSNGKYWFEVLDRSGMLGPGALALPLVMEEKRYGKPALIPILGPGAERAYDLLQGEAQAFDYFPVYSQLDTRALER